MKHTSHRLSSLFAFIPAVLVAAIIGSVVQTQFNLWAISSIGPNIDWPLRAAATWHDLQHFAPLFAIIVAVSLLLALPIAHLIVRIQRRQFIAWCAVAGAVGLWVAFLVINHLAPMPTLIAATRTTTGTLAMTGSGLIGGLVYASCSRILRKRLVRKLRARKQQQRGQENLLALLALSAASLTLTHMPQAVAATSENQAKVTAVTTESSPYRYETLYSELNFPWSLAFLPTNTLLITERAGFIVHMQADGELISRFPAPLADLWVDGQAGLFDIALSPDFQHNQHVFISYACGSAQANNTCLAKFTWDDETLVDGHVIFRASPAKRGSAHYGGRIAFKPDGTLLLTLGDGFDYREDAQRVTNHLGAVVRLNQNGSVPSDNPIFSHRENKPEIFTYGHRNVQGIAWHPLQQRMFISEHGPRGGDEINRLRSGANYGWPLITQGVDYTGALITPYRTLPGLTEPEFNWTPSIAPAGLAVYSGNMFSAWNGDLLVPALAGKHVARLRFYAPEPGTAVGTANGNGYTLQQEEQLFHELNQRIRDVRVHPRTGALYLLTDSASGSVIRVTPSN